MEKLEIKIPSGYEVEKTETTDGKLTVTFKEAKPKLPRSWEEFCEMFPVPFAFRSKCDPLDNRRITTQVNIPCVMADFTEDLEISDALIALIKLILLRNAYNGDWVPDYKTADTKFTIEFDNNRIVKNTTKGWPCILIFKSEELRDEFLRNFKPLIEKLKPLYGIKEGGEK